MHICEVSIQEVGLAVEDERGDGVKRAVAAAWANVTKVQLAERELRDSSRSSDELHESPCVCSSVIAALQPCIDADLARGGQDGGTAVRRRARQQVA